MPIRRRARMVLGLWLALLATTTAVRARVWHDELALWQDAAAQAPEKLRPQVNLGRAYELAGDLFEAERAYKTVIGLSFDVRQSAYQRRFARAAAETNLAHLAMKAGQFATAMRILDSALEVWPEFPFAHYNRAAIFWTVGACDLAREEYQIASRQDVALPQLPSTPCTASP